MHRSRVVAAIGAFALAAVAITGIALRTAPTWSANEIVRLRGLTLAALPPLAPDPSNALADDPRAATLGHRLFFDTRFSGNGSVSCASCHLPTRGFTDGRPLAEGIGMTDRTTMPIVGTQYGTWLFWDGRKDSQWAQALGPLESAVEHGGTRGQYAHLIAEFYRTEYETLFGALPDLADRSRFPYAAGPSGNEEQGRAWAGMSSEDQDAVTRIYVNMGKVIAAYERALRPGTTRFDRYVAAVVAGDDAGARAALSADETAGLRLFIGRAQCTNCHNGALLSNGGFHNTGVPPAAGLPRDGGRASGARLVAQDEFNCLSRWSDAPPESCTALRFLDDDSAHLDGQFKVPSLRSVSERGPYMHAGQFTTLDEVVAHYNSAPTAAVGHSELRGLHLSSNEIRQLVAFLQTLEAAPDAPAGFLSPPTP